MAAGSTPASGSACPDGRGSAAGFGRRLAALTIDWLLGYLIAGLFAGPDALASPNFSWTVLGIWFVLTAVAVAVFGISRAWPRSASGWRRCGRRCVGVPRAVLRTALIALVLPALVRDADGRGWHDRAARHGRRPHPGLTRDPLGVATGHVSGGGRCAARCASSRPPGGGPWAGPPPGSRARRGAASSESISAGGDVARQLHDVALQLAERDLALVVADDDVVDRGLAHHPGVALLLLGEQALDAVRGALGDQDDARPADHAVHGVEVRGARDARGDPPRARASAPAPSPRRPAAPRPWCTPTAAPAGRRCSPPPARRPRSRSAARASARRRSARCRRPAGRRPGRPRPSAGRASCPRAAGS